MDRINFELPRIHFDVKLQFIVFDFKCYFYPQIYCSTQDMQGEK